MSHCSHSYWPRSHHSDKFGKNQLSSFDIIQQTNKQGSKNTTSLGRWLITAFDLPLIGSLSTDSDTDEVTSCLPCPWGWRKWSSRSLLSVEITLKSENICDHLNGFLTSGPGEERFFQQALRAVLTETATTIRTQGSVWTGWLPAAPVDADRMWDRDIETRTQCILDCSCWGYRMCLFEGVWRQTVFYCEEWSRDRGNAAHPHI